LEHPPREVLPHLIRHLGRQAGPRVVHGEHDPEQLQVRIEHPAQEFQCVAELPEPLQRVVLALDRDQHRRRRGEAVDRKQAERGRAVEQHIVVVIGHAVERYLQPRLPGEHTDQLHLGAGQVNGRGDQAQVRDGRVHRRRGDRDVTG